jgi:rhamnogalacturonan endolyase
MLMQTDSWPYDFLNSSDFPRARQRGVVSGRLFVRDVALARADSAFIGLAPPGTIGSWQVESKVHFLITQS